MMVARRAIMLSTTPAQVVLDPFAAQGVIGQVAKLCGRGYLGVELDRGRYHESRWRLLGGLRRQEMKGDRDEGQIR